MVQQVDCRKPLQFLPVCRSHRRSRLGPPRREAREAAAQLQKVYPGFTVHTWARLHFTDDPTFNAQYQRIVEGLRKAGVPEGEKKTD